MNNEYGKSLLDATDLELNQRIRYVNAFENEYKLTHHLEPLRLASANDIGIKAKVSYISTVAINLTTAGATGTIFYFLELEVLAREFKVDITNWIVVVISALFALAAVLGIDFTLTSTGLAKGESDEMPYSNWMTHWAAGVTAAMAGIFRGLLYFQIIPPGSQLEIWVKSVVLLAIAVLPVLVLYPAARISGFYMGWVDNENRRRTREYTVLATQWREDFNEALKAYISSRVSTANTLQRKMADSSPQPSTTVYYPHLDGAAAHIRRAFLDLCDNGNDPFLINPRDVERKMKSVGVTGIKEGTLRPAIMRVRVEKLNDVLEEMDSSPFSPPEEILERFSTKYGRQIHSNEISPTLMKDMQDRFGSRQ